MAAEEQRQFIEYLKLLVFSHRHNKNDFYLKDTIASFDLVRDPNYKYSKHAEAAFFALPVYSFLFACFSVSTKGQNFAQDQLEEKGDKDPASVQRMKVALGCL